jgi:hypothetical protein
MEIPIAPLDMEDFVAWHYTSNGIFTVRSAYHAEWDYRFGQNERKSPGRVEIRNQSNVEKL